MADELIVFFPLLSRDKNHIHTWICVSLKWFSFFSVDPIKFVSFVVFIMVFFGAYVRESIGVLIIMRLSHCLVRSLGSFIVETVYNPGFQKKKNLVLITDLFLVDGTDQMTVIRKALICLCLVDFGQISLWSLKK